MKAIIWYVPDDGEAAHFANRLEGALRYAKWHVAPVMPVPRDFVISDRRTLPVAALERMTLLNRAGGGMWGI